MTPLPRNYAAQAQAQGQALPRTKSYGNDAQSRTLLSPKSFDEKWFILPPHVLGPKYDRRQRPRNSQGFRIGKSLGNLAMTPDVASVISLNRFLAPVDDNVLVLSSGKNSRYFHTLGCENIFLQKSDFLHTQKRLFHTLKNDFIP